MFISNLKNQVDIPTSLKNPDVSFIRNRTTKHVKVIAQEKRTTKVVLLNNVSIEFALQRFQNRRLFFAAFFIKRLVISSKFLLELLNTTECVNELLLTGVKRVRSTRNIDEVDRILVSVFPLDRLFSGDRRLSQNRKICNFVFENYRTIIWVNIRFHGSTRLACINLR
jgi:hypothetical protein